MRYSIIGTLWLSRAPERVRTLTWEDGRLSGDAYARFCLMVAAVNAEGELLGPPEGPHTRTGHLSSPVSTMILAHSLFSDGYEVVGDYPDVTPGEGCL